jgi:hypothetical protein
MQQAKTVTKRWRMHALVAAVWAIACWGTAFVLHLLNGNSSDCSDAMMVGLGSVIFGIVTVPLLVCLVATGYSRRSVTIALLGFVSTIACFRIPTVGWLVAFICSFGGCRIMLTCREPSPS